MRVPLPSNEPERVAVLRVHDLFDVDPRGPDAMHGKGDLPMYFVNRIRSHLSSGSDGTASNEHFERERLRI